MAYFSNGSESMILDCECAECPVPNEDICPIVWVQTEANYEAIDNPLATKILNCLVKQGEDGEYLGCQMKPIIDELMEMKNG